MQWHRWMWSQRQPHLILIKKWNKCWRQSVIHLPAWLIVWPNLLVISSGLEDDSEKGSIWRWFWRKKENSANDRKMTVSAPTLSFSILKCNIMAAPFMFNEKENHQDDHYSNVHTHCVVCLCDHKYVVNAYSEQKERNN